MEKEEEFLQGFLRVESSFRDFVDLKEEIDKLAYPESTFDKMFNYLTILKNQGIDINSIGKTDKLKVIKTNGNCTFQIVEKKTFIENGKKIILNVDEYKEPGLINIGDYVLSFRQGKANSNITSIALSTEEINKLKDIGFKFNWERDPILNPKIFEDYILVLQELKKKGYDLNSIKKDWIIKIAKINDTYEFEFFNNAEQLNKQNDNTRRRLDKSGIISIGRIIYEYKRAKNTNRKDNLKLEQIKQLEDEKVGLVVVPQDEINPMLHPRGFEDYALILQEIHKKGYDINNIISGTEMLITKINDTYEFEFFPKNSKACSKNDNIHSAKNKSKLIRIGNIINLFKRGLNTSKRNMTATQIKQLEDEQIGLKVKLETERDPIMEPKCFEDYTLILQELQKVKSNTGYDINDIRSKNVIMVTKINGDYKFEIFKNREEAEKKYGKTVETIGIGEVISSLRKGKFNHNRKDLELSQIKDLIKIGLEVNLETERDIIMEPKCFADYVDLLKELQKAKDKTGRDINDIKKEEVLRITKINDEYYFEIFDNREKAKERYGKDVKIIGIGDVIVYFKKGKTTSNKDLEPDQIEQLTAPAVGLKVVTNPILKPRSFDDYVLVLQELQKNKIDINAIVGADKIKITKNGNGYDFQIISKKTIFKNGKTVTVNKEEYGQDDLILIGDKIGKLRNGKYSLSTYLTVGQMQTLLSIGFRFNKGIEDIIYKKEICKAFNIDITLNQEIINRISKLELISKIKYLIKEKNMPILDSNGKLVDIFSMSSPDIEEKYGISLETIINTYGKGVTKK